MAEVDIPIADVFLDYLNDGLYVCDRDRRILYWSKSAERITGWTAEDVVGHRCLDNILVHIDQDGRQLCGEEFCPLHRSMCTDTRSSSPLIVFGQTKTGGRIPLAVSVAPIHGTDGQVIGGVETFTDYSESYANLERARLIQTLSLEHDLPQDSRVLFSTSYLPHDMIGGDYFAIRQLDADHYGFFLADVMGHGVAAALYTMHLSSLWSRYFHTLMHPAEFAHLLNRDLCQIVRDESFATAVCGVLDAARRSVRVVSAGGPPLVVVCPDGRSEQVNATGLPFGMAGDAAYDECEFRCSPGDCLLMFTDGAIEIQNAAGRMLGTAGLIGILNALEYPKTGIRIEPLQEALLSFSNGIRLDDDLTLLEARFS
jgi:PAS domain S-box-containing protein